VPPHSFELISVEFNPTKAKAKATLNTKASVNATIGGGGAVGASETSAAALARALIEQMSDDEDDVGLDGDVDVDDDRVALANAGGDDDVDATVSSAVRSMSLAVDGAIDETRDASRAGRRFWQRSFDCRLNNGKSVVPLVCEGFAFTPALQLENDGDLWLRPTCLGMFARNNAQT
jgi:hypothetical protein